MKKIIPIILIFIIPFIFSLILDRVIGLFGFPVETPIRYAHPTNYKEHIKNVEFEYEFKTNSQGLRYKDIPLAKPEGEFRIFMAGDSCTEGVGVNSNETFGSLLEEHFNSGVKRQVAFINGGLAGTGPLEYWRVFSNVGLKYNLDGLLICLFANDLSDMPERVTLEDLYSMPPQRHGIRRLVHALYPRVYTAVKRLREQKGYNYRTKPSDTVTTVSNRAREIGISEEKIEKWKETVPKELVAAANRGEFGGGILSWGLLSPWYLSDSLDIDTERAERKYSSMIVTLEKMANEAANRGIEVAMIYIPIKLQYDPSAFMADRPWIRAGAYCRKSWLAGQCELQKRLERWTSQKRIPFLDLTPSLREAMKANRPLNWELDPHWNREGNQVVSGIIANWIEKEKVFRFAR